MIIELSPLTYHSDTKSLSQGDTEAFLLCCKLTQTWNITYHSETKSLSEGDTESSFISEINCF